MSGQKIKTCSKCRKEYPATTGYFPPCGHTLDKLHSWCRFCHREAAKKYRQCHRKKRKNYQKKYYKMITGYLRHIFFSFRGRCTNSNAHNYSRYGGRGIKCLFQSSDEFVDYVVNTLKIDPRGLQIDRIDNNGHYEKGNIQFVTAKENCSNRRNSKNE